MKRLIIVAALLALPSIAHADAVADSDARFKEGVALQKQGNIDGARDKYLQSLVLHRSAAALINLAVLEADARHSDVALKYLREWLKHPGADPSKKVDADKMLAVLEGETARMAVKAPPGQEVMVDGTSRGNAPIREALDVMPGAHRVACGAKSIEVTLSAGQRLEVDVTETPAAKPPGADVEKGDWLLPATLGGLGAIGLGVGAVLGIVSSSARSDAEKAGGGLTCVTTFTPECASVRSSVDTMNATGTGSVIGYVAGGALVVSAVVTALVTQPWKERPRKIAVMPSLGGVMAVGTF